MIKILFGSIGATIATLALLFGLAYLSYLGYAFFAPKYRAVDSKVFYESEQYNQGMIRDLSELQRQYVTANEEDKAALRPVILHRFSVYPTEKMPVDLREFYELVKNSSIVTK